MTITPEQAKAAYEAAQQTEVAAKAALKAVKDSQEPVEKAFRAAKEAYDGLKPALSLAKAQVAKASAEVTITLAAFKAVAPKEATEATGKGAGNKELLAHVQTLLSGKADGLSNQDIYDGLVAAGVEMAGADPRANLTSYLSRWGTAGSLINIGKGIWGYNVPVEAPPVPALPSFLAPVDSSAPITDAFDASFPGFEALNEAGITTREQLAGKTAADLTAIPGIGAKTADKILAAV